MSFWEEVLVQCISLIFLDVLNTAVFWVQHKLLPLSKTQWPVLLLLLWQCILCSWLLLIWKPQVAISLTTNCHLLMSLYRPPWSVRLLGWGSIIICALREGRSHLPIKHSSRRHVTYNKNPPSHPSSLQSGWLYVFYPLLRKNGLAYWQQLGGCYIYQGQVSMASW